MHFIVRTVLDIRGKLSIAVTLGLRKYVSENVENTHLLEGRQMFLVTYDLKKIKDV